MGDGGGGLRVERTATPPVGTDGLLAAAGAHDGRPPFEETTVRALAPGAPQPWLVAAHRDGRLVGLAALPVADDARLLEVVVHPDDRRRGVGTALVDEGLRLAASLGAAAVRAWAHPPAAAARALAAHAGMHVERELLVLVRPLPAPAPPPTPTGVTVRAFDPGRDDDAWLALNNAAFEGHPEQGGWTADDLAWRLAQPWSDPRRFVVAEDEAGVVAAVWTKLPPGSRRGELYVVATAPRAQGRGLGALVVGHALARLTEAGCAEAELYVDAANSAALRTYARAGFTEEQRHTALLRRLDADPPDGTDRAVGSDGPLGVGHPRSGTPAGAWDRSGVAPGVEGTGGVAKDAAQLQAEIEATRAQLARTIDLINDRVSPKRVAGRGAARVRATVGDLRERIPREVRAAAGDQPWKPALAVAGVVAGVAGAVLAVRRLRA